MPDIIYPLSAVDLAWGLSVYTTTHLISKPSAAPFDVGGLAAAIQRVAEKWRLVAGRIIRDESGQFCILIPTGPLTEPVVAVTTRTFDQALNWEPVAVGPFRMSSRPPKEYFVPPSTPSNLAAYAEQRHPLVLVHVSHFDDATCIGFTLPHGIFDGIGRGFVMQAIEDELAGREWTPLPLIERDIFSDAVADLSEHDGQRIEEWKGAFPKPTVWNVLTFLCGLWYETFWHRAETRTLYLDELTVQRLVKDVKDQVSTSGKQVSTGDVISGWFVKAATAGERFGSGHVSVITSISFRDLLAEKDPTFKTYPHNAIANCPLYHIPTSILGAMPLAELTVLHRSQLASFRTCGFLGAYARYLGMTASGSSPIILRRQLGTCTFIVSNKMSVPATAIEFGGGTEAMGYWEMNAHRRIDMDHLIFVNRFKGGYTLMGKMRRSRWQSVAKAAEALANGEFHSH